jgi:Ca-activated chloride channel family protein
MISSLWDQIDPGFFAPIWLLVGVAALIAVVLLEIGSRRRRQQAMRLFVASHLVAELTASISPWKRLLKSALIIAAVGLLFIAMARPHLFFQWQEENRSGTDILIAVDCSKSMLTEDVKPNRLERAKLAIADFADRLSDDRLGLIVFAGQAFLQCPLTLDHDAFQTAVRELDTNTIPEPGTDIATAIDQAVDALKSQPANMKIMILVTDGEDLEGRVLAAAKNAAQAGLKIYTVGVGTPNGDRIPERDDTGAVYYHQDANGQEVISKLDENTLGQIASLTGGAYAALGQRGEGLDEIYDDYIAPLPKQNLEEKREKIRFERFEWPLSLAILFLMWEFMINDRATPSVPTTTSPVIAARRPPRRRSTRDEPVTTTPLLILGFVLTSSLLNPAWAGDADTAERDYKAGQYEQAMENYKDAAQSQPSRSDLDYNQGAAAYKAGDYSEAEEAFRRALETPDLKLQEDTYYNLGNAQFKHGEALQKVDSKKAINLWEKALHSYDSALKLRTTADAHNNYEYVKKMLEQLKQQQQQQQQNQKNQSGNKSQDQSGQGSSQDQQGKQGQNPSQQDSGDNNPQNNGQDSQPPSDQQGDNSGPDKKNAPKDTNGQQSDQDKQAQNNPVRTYSGTRDQDQKDPGIKSREDAENLLDSLKDDERHVTARSLSGNAQNPPPPSGKDW